MRNMARISNGIIGAAVLAASLALGAAPAGAQDHDRGGHGHFEGHGGPRYEGHGGPRYEGHGGPRYEGHGGPRYEGHGGPRYGGHFEDHFDGRPRYAVPPHWEGMHPHWGDDDDRGYWVRPWGPRWVPRYWGGGYWGGAFWPHVYLGWDFPWFLAALPVGSVTYWWGGVPYYYWRGVYYVWSPDYGQYVVTDPPPLSGGVVQGAAPPPAATQPGNTGGRG